MLSDRESDSIKVFDPTSPVFLACVATLSGILLVCLVGAGVGVLLTRRLNSNQLRGTDREKSTLKGKIGNGFKGGAPGRVEGARERSPIPKKIW